MYKCVWKIPEISREANNIYYIANIDLFKYIYIYIYITKKSVGMLQRIMGCHNTQINYPCSKQQKTIFLTKQTIKINLDNFVIIEKF